MWVRSRPPGSFCGGTGGWVPTGTGGRGPCVRRMGRAGVDEATFGGVCSLCRWPGRRKLSNWPPVSRPGLF